ncbi:MAG: hypothetical protein KatS3mg057_3193 [Herpetosiphonaceae bacterium]|nr:MAG: hypothetical protein KatS3mg057_3193 [Herpetosiphonaceae bacterium]
MGWFHHCLAADGADTRLIGGAGDLLLEVVHIDKGGGAAADHLGAGEQRPLKDERGIDEAALDRKHIAEQPDIELLVGDDATQQAHRHMGMPVDQPRNNHLAGAVKLLGGAKSPPQLLCRPDGDNRAAADGDSAILDDASLRVHGDDGTAID